MLMPYAYVLLGSPIEVEEPADVVGPGPGTGGNCILFGLKGWGIPIHLSACLSDTHSSIYTYT